MAIEGARGSQYTVGTLDLGSRLRVRVRAFNGAGEAEGLSRPSESVGALATPEAFVGTTRADTPLTDGEMAAYGKQFRVDHGMRSDDAYIASSMLTPAWRPRGAITDYRSRRSNSAI